MGPNGACQYLRLQNTASRPPAAPVSRPLHPRSAAERVASGTCYTAHRPAGSGRGPPGIAGWLWGAWGAREAHGGRADRT